MNDILAQVDMDQIKSIVAWVIGFMIPITGALVTAIIVLFKTIGRKDKEKSQLEEIFRNELKDMMKDYQDVQEKTVEIFSKNLLKIEQLHENFSMNSNQMNEIKKLINSTKKQINEINKKLEE